ncbi:MAG: PAS domain S-box protein [Geobacteraceae bacterium]|nr:PAS domain S-box protein [Geobacteraceae bacterium]
MEETVTIPVGKLVYLEERARKLAREKSYLQLVMRLINRVSAVSGLDDMINCMMRNILDVVGGGNIILYYQIGSEIFSTDVYGNRTQLSTIEDELVLKVHTTREPVEVEHDFSDTRMTTPEFGKAYTWVYPLLVGQDLIGVLKMECLHIGMRELYQFLPSFFNYTALTLKNEILSGTRLKQAYDQLIEMNEELQLEIAEREQTEEELGKARDELELRVQERTADLNRANERLQQELTEREREQEKLRKYSEEIHDLYNRAPCGYHSLDDNGVFIRINDTELQWLGYQREELVGRKRFTDIVSPRSQQIFLDNFPRFKERGWVKNLEFDMQRKDGTILPVLLNASAVSDSNGNFLMSRSTIHDITERRKAEEKEHLLSAIVHSSDDAIIAKDLKGEILSWNRGAERIYGYSADESIGRSISMLIPPGKEAEFHGILEAINRGEHIEHYVTERKRKDGQLISISLTVSPISDLGGNILGASSIARDITEQRHSGEEINRLNRELEERVEARTNDLKAKRVELEESQLALMNIVEDLNLKTEELEAANSKLQELDRLKSMFIASMSHELRTPLNSIIGFSSILRDEWLGPVNAEQKENLDTIQRSGKHLLNLINDVIDVSKIEAGRIESRIEEFDLYDLMKEAVQYLGRDLHDKGLELHLDIHHHQLRSDRRRLLQCVINLLSNAVKFTEHGMVTISAAGADNRTDENGWSSSVGRARPVIISVRDTGVGIDEQDIHRLFQPFVRLESPLKTIAPGTGLGLYLTRKLVVEVLGGDIVCTSNIGTGSTFTLRIPERIYEKGAGGRG